MLKEKITKKKSRANRRKERTPKTHNNKLTKLQAFYRRLFKQSTKSKETDKTPRVKGYFCDKYLTFANFKAVQVLRVNDHREPEVKKSTINRSQLKKKGLLGGYG